MLLEKDWLITCDFRQTFFEYFSVMVTVFENTTLISSKFTLKVVAKTCPQRIQVFFEVTGLWAFFFK